MDVPQLSVDCIASGLGNGTSSAHSTDTSGGQTIIGGVLSSTVIVCIQVAEFWQMSMAVHVRTIVYSCGQLPGSITSIGVTTGVAVQLSVAVAVPVLAGAVLAVHSTVIFAGQVMTGGTSSSIVMN